MAAAGSDSGYCDARYEEGTRRAGEGGGDQDGSCSAPVPCSTSTELAIQAADGGLWVEDEARLVEGASGLAFAGRAMIAGS